MIGATFLMLIGVPHTKVYTTPPAAIKSKTARMRTQDKTRPVICEGGDGGEGGEGGESGGEGGGLSGGGGEGGEGGDGQVPGPQLGS